MKVSPDIIGLDNNRLDMKMDQKTIPSLYFFNILKNGLKYIGLYMEKRIAHKIYCVVISVLVWINFARFISIFFTMKDTSDRMMGIGAVASFLIVIPLNSTANMYALTKYLDNIFRLIGDYTEHYGIHSNIIKIRKRCPALLAIMVIFGVCIFIAITLLTILLPISEESLLMNSYTPAQNWSIYMFSIAVFVINYFAFHGGLQLMLFTFFYCLVCYFIGSEYRIISTDLFNLVEDGNFEEHESKIEIIRQQHEAVTRILDSSNYVLQNVVFFIYAGAIPLICFVIYGLIKGGLPSEDMAAFSQIICLTIILVIIVTTAGSLINTMVSIVNVSSFAKYRFKRVRDDLKY